MKFRHLVATAAAGITLAGALAACGNLGSSSSTGSGSGSGSGSSGDIVIGASIPLTGGLAGFGYFEKWGYQHAIDAVNSAGGISIGGVKKKVKLIILDDQTDPNTTVSNVQRLITSDHVTALLGSCTDSLVIPGALIAERAGVPMVTPCSTTNGFVTYPKWKWVWDIFFNSEDLTQAPFKMIKEYNLKTNLKVAVIHSDGASENTIGGTLWPMWAKQYGMKVVYDVPFSPSSTQFTSDLQAAKASGAQVLLTVGQPPALIAMRKQMVTVGFDPKLVVMEEGGEPLAFSNALGKLANGVIVGGYWDYTFPFPGAKTIRTEFEAQTHTTYSQHIADTDAAAAVLLDAIKRAGSLSASKIATAIQATNLETVVGDVQFTAEHTYTLPMVEEQWQNGHSYVVAPADRSNAKLIYPISASG